MHLVLLSVKNIALIKLEENTIDSSNCEMLSTYIREALPLTTKIVIDLCTLEFVDSSFLNMLLGLYREVIDAAGELRVVATNPIILSLFQLVYFNRIIEVYSNVANALNKPFREEALGRWA